MKVAKKNLNEALRVLGKVVCQTSPVELYKFINEVGGENHCPHRTGGDRI